MYRVGIVGCGGISGVHAKVLSGMEDVSLVACADILPQRAQALADQYGCRAYDSFIGMLEGEPLDAVHICAPHHLHPMMAGEAARLGIACVLALWLVAWLLYVRRTGWPLLVLGRTPAAVPVAELAESAPAMPGEAKGGGDVH